MLSGADHSPQCPSTLAMLPGSCQHYSIFVLSGAAGRCLCNWFPKALLLLWLWDSTAAPCSALAERRVTPLMGLKEQQDNTLSLQGILPCGAEQPTAALRAELPLHSARAQGWVLVAQSLMKTPEGK